MRREPTENVFERRSFFHQEKCSKERTTISVEVKLISIKRFERWEEKQFQRMKRKVVFRIFRAFFFAEIRKNSVRCKMTSSTIFRFDSKWKKSRSKIRVEPIFRPEKFSRFSSARRFGKTSLRGKTKENVERLLATSLIGETEKKMFFVENRKAKIVSIVGKFLLLFLFDVETARK